MACHLGACKARDRTPGLSGLGRFVHASRVQVAVIPGLAAWGASPSVTGRVVPVDPSSSWRFEVLGTRCSQFASGSGKRAREGSCENAPARRCRRCRSSMHETSREPEAAPLDPDEISGKCGGVGVHGVASEIRSQREEDPDSSLPGSQSVSGRRKRPR